MFMLALDRKKPISHLDPRALHADGNKLSLKVLQHVPAVALQGNQF